MTERYRFKALGPFKVPVIRAKRSGKRKIDFANARSAVFGQAQEICGHLIDIEAAVGCYVFGLSPPGSAKTRPYYVGQACHQTLFTRVFQPSDKPTVYNGILGEYEKASPFVYLLPLLTPTGRLASLGADSTARRIDLAEHELIGMALRSNPNLWNVQHRVAMESFVIEGTPAHKGAKSQAAKRFSHMLNLAAPKKKVMPAGEPLPSPEFIAETAEDHRPLEEQPGGLIDITVPASSAEPAAT